jgi:hypothetical protein
MTCQYFVNYLYRPIHRRVTGPSALQWRTTYIFFFIGTSPHIKSSERIGHIRKKSLLIKFLDIGRLGVVANLIAGVIHVVPTYQDADIILTLSRKKSPTSKREGATAPVKAGDEFRLGVA